MPKRDKKPIPKLFVSLLIAFVAAVAGLGVIWVQSLPNMTIAGNKVTIANCDLPLPTYAIGVCPKLYCKKEIIESGRFPVRTQIGFSKAKPSADPILTGAIRYLEDGESTTMITGFECELDGRVVKEVRYDHQAK